MDKHRSDDLMPSPFLLQLSGLLTLQSFPGEGSLSSQRFLGCICQAEETPLPFSIFLECTNIIFKCP